MDSTKIFTDETDLAGDMFTDFEDDECVESFSDFEINIPRRKHRGMLFS